MHHAGVIAHLPFEQSLEQHSPFAPQVLPADLQARLIGAHFPPVQVPPQQEASVVQAPLSTMHA